MQIDLALLGMLMERPQSAYDLQKDVEYHNYRRWTRISVPSVYKKVVTLREKGYLTCETVVGTKNTDKCIYSVTEKGKAYFYELMEALAENPVVLQLDCWVVVSNLNKLEKSKAIDLLDKVSIAIARAAEANEGYSAIYADIPLCGRTVLDAQRRVYGALKDWIEALKREYVGD